MEHAQSVKEKEGRRKRGGANAPLEEGGDGVEHGGLHLQQGRGEGGQVFHHRHLEERKGEKGGRKDGC
jgi:hypothetical protein